MPPDILCKDFTVLVGMWNHFGNKNQIYSISVTYYKFFFRVFHCRDRSPFIHQNHDSMKFYDIFIPFRSKKLRYKTAKYDQKLFDDPNLSFDQNIFLSYALILPFFYSFRILARVFMRFLVGAGCLEILHPLEEWFTLSCQR